MEKLHNFGQISELIQYSDINQRGIPEFHGIRDLYKKEEENKTAISHTKKAGISSGIS